MVWDRNGYLQPRLLGGTTVPPLSNPLGYRFRSTTVSPKTRPADPFTPERIRVPPPDDNRENYIDGDPGNSSTEVMEPVASQLPLLLRVNIGPPLTPGDEANPESPRPFRNDGGNGRDSG